MKSYSLLIVFLFLNFHSLIGQNIQSPEEFLGYKIGTRFTRHVDVVRYFEHVAQNSDLVQYHNYGRTYEFRPLTYAVISTEENLNNLEDIRKNHLRNTGVESGSYNKSSEKAIVWLSYNVHGNESSSTEASMKTLYELVTSKKDWLENLVVIMDPCVNPDGRDRYANWYNQVKAEPYTTSPMAIEHNEPWPGGRANHYLFDLNRDWAWATQIETKQRLEIYNQWLPHIHVDFHEQGINEPYYFAPAAEPFHEIITPFQRDFQTEIGKNHARYFDEEGWLYFTKERFDLLYPSYGDTYPTYLGSIGMTYEQAGGGSAFLGIDTREGYELSLVDRVEHHHTTGLSTVEIAAKNVEKLNTEFQKFYSNENQEYKSFVLSGNADKLAALKQLLDLHEISYSNAQPGKVRGFNYSNNDNSGFTATEKSLVINTNQPKGKMVSVLFEPSAQLSDSLTYDITAWSLPHAYGLDAVASTKEVSAGIAAGAQSIKNTATPAGPGYITKWNSMQDAKFLAALLKENIRVRFSEVTFENNGKKFDRGSLIITKSDNRTVENFDSKLVEIANEHQRQLTAATTSFATSGPDFGSPEIKPINSPRIGVLRGDDISSLSYGEIWHFFEQQLEYPATSIGTDYFGDVDLSKLDVLILPSGYYGRILNEDGLEKIKTWVRAGGKVIALGSSVGYFAGKDGMDLEEKKTEEEKDTTSSGNLIPYNQRERESIKDLITGSIVQTSIDHTHPMAFGYGKSYFSLKLSNDSFGLLEDGYNVAYLQENPEIVSGFAGSEARKNIINSMTYGVEPMGRGSLIYMVDNPLFRAFWENGKLFFVNAIFFVDNDDLNR
ncbi:M14 family metallopeptidase [Antarcticibacterium sp. 1MA-6-2]|uniref:M14 family metallopeptidase n=1 Tax=Antarcticibacterium sp. 1MA-6-2 TaxID=2908210 RepID=UPI001F46758A|nr:M14 family metallopeptidase [Antarcticibacterium sp. 1MA-6-2]UJH92373.1 M14 family metallopeptidase [Antarcticibacterium sp. 1MA-6-2]